jgi:hypothetical protein
MYHAIFRGSLPVLLLIAVTTAIFPAAGFSEEALVKGVPYVVRRSHLD